MDVTGKPWVRHYFWPIFCLSIIHKISECLKLEGAAGCHLVQPLWSSRDTYSRLLRVMSSWLLNISQEGHPTSSLGKLCQCLVTLTGEKCFLVFKIQGYETSPLPQLNSLLLSQTSRLRRFRSFFSFSCLNLCIHLSLVLSVSAAGDCFVTEDVHLCPYLKVQFSWRGAATFPFLQVGSCSACSLWGRTLRGSLQ